MRKSIKLEGCFLVSFHSFKAAVYVSLLRVPPPPLQTFRAYFSFVYKYGHRNVKQSLKRRQQLVVERSGEQIITNRTISSAFAGSQNVYFNFARPQALNHAYGDIAAHTINICDSPIKIRQAITMSKMFHPKPPPDAKAASSSQVSPAPHWHD